MIALVTPKGDALAFEREYNEWGEKISVTGDKGLERNIPWAFAGLIQHPFFDGEILQSDTRQYIPSTGLWASADNLVKWNPNALKELPGNWNALLYASGDPVNNIDPTGHATYSLTIGMAIGASEHPQKTGGKYFENNIGFIFGNSKNNSLGVAGLYSEGKSKKITGVTAGVGFTLSFNSGKIEDVKGTTKNEIYSIIGFNVSFGLDPNNNRNGDWSIGFGGKGFGLASVISETYSVLSNVLE